MSELAAPAPSKFKQELGNLLSFVLNTVRGAIENTPESEKGRGKTPVMPDDTRKNFLAFRTTHPAEWAKFIEYAGRHENRDLEPVVPSNPELADVQEKKRAALELYRALHDKEKELLAANPEQVQEVAIAEVCSEFRRALSNQNKISRSNPFNTVAEAIGETWNVSPGGGDDGSSGEEKKEDEPDSPPAG